MDNGLIPGRYAKALYKLAVEKGNSEEVYEEMKSVVAAFETTPGLEKVLSNPFVDRSEKEKLLLTAAGDRVEDDYRGFVKLILDNKREEFARSMAIAYCDIYRQAHHIAKVVITTASAMYEDEMDKIRSLVRNAYKDYELEYGTVVDPNLIGGFVIDVAGNRLDSSLSNEIEQLRLNLLRSN